MVSAVTALICVVGYFAVPRLLDRQEEVMFRYKTARYTTATVVRKEHRANARPEWVIYYRVGGFPIYSFHQNKTGQWEQGDIDSNATRTLDIAEQRRNQQSGDQETSVSQNQYDSLSVGDRLAGC